MNRLVTVPLLLIGIAASGMFLFAGAAGAEEKTQNACDAWNFHGLTPGMEKAEAEEFYKLKSKAHFLGERVAYLDHAQSPGRFKARIRFQNSRLLWVSYDFPAGFFGLRGVERGEAIRATLTERLGQPLEEKHRVRDSPWIDFLLDTRLIFQIDRIVWANEECNTVVMAVTGTVRTLLGESGDTVMIVYDFERYVENQQKRLKQLIEIGSKYLGDAP